MSDVIALASRRPDNGKPRVQRTETAQETRRPEQRVRATIFESTNDEPPRAA